MEGPHFIVLDKIIIHSGLELKGENGLSLSFEKYHAEMVPNGDVGDPWVCKQPTRSLFKNLLTYFWLCCLCCYEWTFSCCNVQAYCSGFSCCGAQALGCMGFSSYGVWAQKLWFMGSRVQVQDLCGRGLDASWHVKSSWARD